MKDLAKTADKIAEKYKNSGVDWDLIRDECDSETYGDLDCFQLDMLTDMVIKRIENFRLAGV